MTRPVIRPNSGILSYDASTWDEWVPDLKRIHQCGPIRRLEQYTPDTALNQNWTVVESTGDSIALLFWRNGAPDVICRYAGEPWRYDAGPWAGAVLPIDMDSAWISSRETANNVVHVHIDSDFARRIAEADHRAGAECRLSPMGGYHDPVLALNAQAVIDAPEVMPRLWWDSMATAMLVRLFDINIGAARSPARGGLAPRVLQRCEDYLIAHLADEVTLDELAAIAGLSPHHFCRAFRQSTGLPPHAWLAARRIERAQALMRAHPQMRLIEVALSVGYASQGSFGAAFKRATGMSPGDWRREMRR